MGISRRTVYRWLARSSDLRDRPCRPHRSPHRTSDALEARVLALRLERRWGPDRIAGVLGMHASTVHRVLRRHQAHRLSRLFPTPPRSFGRFDVSAPGELVAVDIKALPGLQRGGGRHPGLGTHHGRHRAVGWRQMHVAIDLVSRLVYQEIRATTSTADTLAFLGRALAWFDARGIRVQRVMSDNGPGYRRTFSEAVQRLGIRHTRIKPYHPWTNGRVERFMGTIARECLQAIEFHSEQERDLAIALYVAYYNAERPHIALEGLSPLTWLADRGVTSVWGERK
jgi:transposase InsO family protein